MPDGSVGSLMAHWPDLRPPASPDLPLNTALARLWNFPGGNSSQRPSLASQVQYILSLVPPPLTPSSPGLQNRTPWSAGPSSQGGSRAAKEGNRSPGDPCVPLPTPHQFQTHLRFIFLCCLLCGGQAFQPTQSWTGQPRPETAVPAKPRAAPACRPLSRPEPSRP